MTNVAVIPRRVFRGLASGVAQKTVVFDVWGRDPTVPIPRKWDSLLRPNKRVDHFPIVWTGATAFVWQLPWLLLKRASRSLWGGLLWSPKPGRNVHITV